MRKKKIYVQLDNLILIDLLFSIDCLDPSITTTNNIVTAATTTTIIIIIIIIYYCYCYMRCERNKG